KPFGALVLAPVAPAEVRNLYATRWTPYVLAVILLVTGGATLVHLLLTSVRRRRRELAILKSVGFLSRQVSATVAWQATTLAIAALVLGIPAGIALGRGAWRLIATRVGLVPLPLMAAG